METAGAGRSQNWGRLGPSVGMAALACVLVAHARVAREFAARLEDGRAQVPFTSGATSAARWLLVAGLGLIGAGFLLRLG